MVYRYSWLAGFASIGFAVVLLNGLIRATVEGPPWQFVVLSGLMLGAVITWAGLTYRLPTWVVAAINLVAAGIAVARVAAPTTTFLFLPSLASFSELRLQLDQAFELIRTGVEPVIPVRGLVVIVMILFWILGALVVWGLQRNHPYVALLPPLVVGLQLATMDRNPSGLGRIVVFLVLVTGSLLAITVDGRDHTSGRMARPGAWAAPPRFVTAGAVAVLGVTVAASLVTVGLFRNAVPYDGVVTWRQSSGLTGDFFGSVSYNPFVGIQQSLVNQSDADVFVATVEGDVPADQLYFRLLTMETYGGGQFFAQRPIIRSLEEGPWELEANTFEGPTASVSTTVQITRLRMDWLPAGYSPVNVSAERSIVGNIGIRSEDGSLRFEGGRSFSGMTYEVASEIPKPDIAALVATEDGSLSPVFDAAANDDDQQNEIPPPADTEIRSEPVDPEIYLDLPTDLDSSIGVLAAQVTPNLTTAFEKGLALEAFLRGFNYSTDIEPGHGAEDLAAWLSDDTSPSYRTGYCEQFATSMAVMARTLGVHSRVVLGFTPGDVLEDGRVVVRDRNAHAWVELWMPTQGWMRFDPTPRSDEVNPTRFGEVNEELGFDIRPYLDVPDPEVGEVLSVPLPPVDFGEEDFSPLPLSGGATDATGGLNLPGWLSIVVAALTGLALLTGLIPGVKWWKRRRRMKRLEQGDISAAWEEITARLTDLKAAPAPAMSPRQAAAGVDPVMQPLASVYSRSLYGPSQSLGQTHIDTAGRSLADTTALFTTKYSKWERLAALYSPGTATPAWSRQLARRLADRRRRNGNGTR
jgi:transglutaminase-like putative cysteine protease